MLNAASDTEHRVAKYATRPARHGSLAAACHRLPRMPARRSYIIGPGKLYDWTRWKPGQKTNTILISMRCSSAIPERTPQHRQFPETIFGEA